jgi:hypothetical protein
MSLCRGISNDKLGDYDAAISDFNAVVALEPKNVNALFSRGFSKDNKGMVGILFVHVWPQQLQHVMRPVMADSLPCLSTAR